MPLSRYKQPASCTSRYQLPTACLLHRRIHAAPQKYFRYPVPMLASTASLLHLQLILQCCQVKKSRKKKCFTALSIFLKLPAQSYNDLILTPGVSGGEGEQYLEVQEASSTWGTEGKRRCRRQTMGVWRCRRKL